MDPDTTVLEDDGEIGPTRSIFEPEAIRVVFEDDRVGPGLELELRLKLAVGSGRERLLRFGSSFDPIIDLELALISAVLESRLSPEPILELGLALEFDQVLESKLFFDPQLVLEAEPLLESKLSLDPVVVLILRLALESRLSLVTVMALEYEMDLELVLQQDPALESLLSRFSLDPGVLLLLVPVAFLCVDGLGLTELV